ncbi:MAG: nitroreductase family protein [Pirellulales bacterium]
MSKVILKLNPLHAPPHTRSATTSQLTSNYAPAKLTQTELDTIHRISATRKTVKVLAESDFPEVDVDALVERLLTCAGSAPFHKVCNPVHRETDLQGIEPWRFYVLRSKECRLLKSEVQNMEAVGKIPAMLAAASAVILSTWLPSPPTGANAIVDSSDSQQPGITHEAFEPTIDNVELIAAASAAVQTMLLAATAAGVKNYWSSGGVLRQPELFARLGIPARERLLGAIFLFPPYLPEGYKAEIATSKLRQQRCPLTSWSKFVELS